MLKRQCPATPPPSSLGDPPSLFPDGPIRPLPSLHTTDPSQHRSKRQRVRPPPLDGALRGWLQSQSAGPHWESDGEEDWTEDAHDLPSSPPPPSTAMDQYKDTNSLLHELHVLNQHRLLFTHPPRDRYPNTNSSVPLPTAHTHLQEPHEGLKPAAWTYGLPYQTAHTHVMRGGREGKSHYFEPAEEKGLVDEVHRVRQRYEDANRLLGSLFLSRRRAVEKMTSSTYPSTS